MWFVEEFDNQCFFQVKYVMFDKRSPKCFYRIALFVQLLGQSLAKYYQ